MRLPNFSWAVWTGLLVPFACSDTNELREELVGSDLTEVHLHHELEFKDYGPLLLDNDPRD
jgi:hypothetical protein